MTAHVRWLAGLGDDRAHAIPPGQDRAMCGRIGSWYQSATDRARCPACALELHAPMTLAGRGAA